MIRAQFKQIVIFTVIIEYKDQIVFSYRHEAESEKKNLHQDM